MASSVWAFSRHATFPRRFPGHSQTAEVSRVRMDFPSYPVDIVLPSFNHADTAHDQLLGAVRLCPKGGLLQRSIRERGASDFPSNEIYADIGITSIMPTSNYAACCNINAHESSSCA